MQKLKNFYKFLRQIYQKEIIHQAAGLSFYTLMSLIPVLLVSMSIFTNLPSFQSNYDKLKSFIFENIMPTNQEILSKYLETFLSNTFGLGILGLITAMFSSILFFANFEFVVSKIMKTPGRSFWRSLSNYWTLMTLVPMGLIASFYLSGIFQDLLNQHKLTSYIRIAYVLPYLIIWAIFLLTYTISINKKIAVKNLVLSSFIASFAWNIGKFCFIQYSIFNKSYASIYGSFSILLFFFIWLYISWMIYLFGIQICFLLDQKDSKSSENNTTNSDTSSKNSQKCEYICQNKNPQTWINVGGWEIKF